MVMSERCIAAEEGLATLRAKYMADEAEMKNAKRAVLELTRERRDALDEVERLKKDLKVRDEDVKAAVEAKDKSVADFKHLVGQIEGAKEAAVSEFRASETFEDINTRYFLSGLKPSGSKPSSDSPVWTFPLFNRMTMRTRWWMFPKTRLVTTMFLQSRIGLIFLCKSILKQFVGPCFRALTCLDDLLGARV
jgi:hypothetical protein